MSPRHLPAVHHDRAAIRPCVLRRMRARAACLDAVPQLLLLPLVLRPWIRRGDDTAEHVRRANFHSRASASCSYVVVLMRMMMMLLLL